MIRIIENSGEQNKSILKILLVNRQTLDLTSAKLWL